jgi:hypothetical protein
MTMPTTEQATVPALVRLASLVREVTAMDQHRDTSTYAGYMAELAALHDEAAKHARDTTEHRNAFTMAVKVFKAARAFASTRPALPHPNEVLRDLGYPV